MSIFYHPPQPFQGGKQPTEGRKLPAQITEVPVNDPPFSHRGRLAITALLIALAQPPDPAPHLEYFGGQQAYTQKKLNPAELHVAPVNDPPFSHRNVKHEVAYQWQQYVQSQDIFDSNLNPAQLDVEYQLASISRQSQIYETWITAEPPQQRARFIAPFTAAAAPVDDPPFSSRNNKYEPAHNAWIEEPQPQQRALSVAPFAVQAQVDNPPFKSRKFDAIYTWYFDRPVINLFHSQITPASRSTDPPRVVKVQNIAIFEAWYHKEEREEVFPGHKKEKKPKLPPSTISVDNPPFSEREDISGILTAWQEPFVLPQTSPKYIPETAIVVNDPPFDGRRLAQLQERTAFIPPDPRFETFVKYVQPFVAADVNDPPFDSRRFSHLPVYQAWEALPDRLPAQYKAPLFINAAGRRDWYLPVDAVPSPVHRYWFYVIDTRPVRVYATNGAYIRDVENVCPIEGYIESTQIGAAVFISCNQPGVWSVMAKNGTWTLSV